MHVGYTAKGTPKVPPQDTASRDKPYKVYLPISRLRSLREGLIHKNTIVIFAVASCPVYFDHVTGPVKHIVIVKGHPLREYSESAEYLRQEAIRVMTTIMIMMISYD